MNYIDIQIPCKSAPGHKEIARIHYEQQTDGTFVFYDYNGCDVMSLSPECEKCFNEVYSNLLKASSSSDLLESYPPAK